MSFHYYEGDHQKGHTLICVIADESLSAADKTFKEMHGKDPKSKGIVVTLEPKGTQNDTLQ